LSFVVFSMMSVFKAGSAQMIMRSIHSMLGMAKCVKPHGFFPFAYRVLTSRLNASMEFQFLF
jgi:hypothetical protein